MQNFLKAKERGIDVQLFVRKNKDDKISKEFYYLGRMTATGRTEEFVMANTDKTAVEIEWRWIRRSEKIFMSILSMDKGDAG